MSLSPLEKIMLGLDIVPVQTYDRPVRPDFHLSKKEIASDIEEACSMAKGHRADLIGFDGCSQRRGRRLIVTAAIFAIWRCRWLGRHRFDRRRAAPISMAMFGGAVIFAEK